MNARIKLSLTAVAAVAALVLGGCGSGGSSDKPVQAASAGSLDQLIAAAKKEGEITFYTGTAQPDAEAWVKDFTDKYGIKVKILRDSSGPLFARWQQEFRAKKYITDTFLGSDPAAMRTADQAGMLADYTPTGDSHFDRNFTIPGKSYPLVFQLQPLTWNTSKVTPQEQQMLLDKGVAALADPAFKNRISLVIPQGTGFIRAEWSRIVDKYGWTLLEAIAKNKPTIYESAVPLTDRLVAGESAVAVFLSDSLSAPQINKGAPLRFEYDDKQAVGWFAVGAAAKAPHPNAARLFVEWATGPDGVKSLAKIRQAMPGRDDVKNENQIAQQTWYKPLAPSNFLASWATDPNFDANAKEFVDRFDKIMGYQP